MHPRVVKADARDNRFGELRDEDFHVAHFTSINLQISPVPDNVEVLLNDGLKDLPRCASV